MSVIPKIKSFERKYRDYKGLEILEVPEGTIISVMKSPGPNNIGHTLVRLRHDEHNFTPFERVMILPQGIERTGETWGKYVDSYTFRVYTDLNIKL